MAKHDMKLVRLFRDKAVKEAEGNLKVFAQSHLNIFDELMSNVLISLRIKHLPDIIKSSYKLHSAASTFGRKDLSDLADLLHRTTKNNALISSNEVLEEFAKSFEKLKAHQNQDENREKVILDDLYKVMRRNNK